MCNCDSRVLSWISFGLSSNNINRKVYPFLIGPRSSWLKTTQDNRFAYKLSNNGASYRILYTKNRSITEVCNIDNIEFKINIDCEKG